jgi:hypothetical protein
MLRIVDDLYTPLKQAAKQRGVSVAALVSIAVHDYLKLEKAKPNIVSKTAKAESDEDKALHWQREHAAEAARAAKILDDWGDDE